VFQGFSPEVCWEVFVKPVVAAVLQEDFGMSRDVGGGDYFYGASSGSEACVGGVSAEGIVDVRREACGFASDGVDWVDGDASFFISEGIFGAVVGVGNLGVGESGAAMVVADEGVRGDVFESEGA
jgi:hypothetical protein